jgi:hypothetical protein
MLSAQILAVMLSLAPAGRSPYSVVVVDACGHDRLAPTCEMKPVCDEPTLACAAPRWSNAHNAFVRQENAEEARERYEIIASAIVRVSQMSTRPTTGPDGTELAPVWPWSTSDLAYGLGTISFHESGFRRDVHEGVGDEALGDCSFTNKATGAPLTPAAASALSKAGGHVRRFCRSVCIAQINTGGLDGEKWGVTGRDLIGLSPDATERCLGAAVKMLAMARARCSRWQTAGDWFTPAIVGYGAGSGCESSAKWARDRVTTFKKFVAGKALDPASPARASL